MREDFFVDNAGLPQTSEELSIESEQLAQLSEFSSAPADDIPAAVREEVERKSQSRWQRSVVLWGLGSIGVLALLSLPLVLWQSRSQTSAAQSKATAAPATGQTPDNRSDDRSENLSENNRSENSSSDGNLDNSTAAPIAASPSDTLLGHLLYAEAPAAELVPVGDGSVVLRQAAAEKFEAMVAAAKADGVNLVPLSGFRSISEQEGVFFDVKAQRGENTTTRAEVSAPPGYSEHHTGYAVDVGDDYFPDADLKDSFENTPAFKWLQDNAGYYSFEMSFPKDNPQGVSYEPWHWRFVGDRASLETFYRARGTATQPSPDAQTSPDSEGDNASSASR